MSEVDQLEFDRRIILGSDSLLRDEEIDFFAYLLHEKLNYEFIRCWTLQHADLAVQIPANSKHIQILHTAAEDISHPNAYKMIGGHWICSYYDGDLIHIYDSVNNSNLDNQIIKKLRMLYGNAFDEETVEFHRVQKQPNSYDCGVFAIANAVTLALGGNPEMTTYRPYKVQDMRAHLLSMFELRDILSFPRSNIHSSTNNRLRDDENTFEKKNIKVPTFLPNIQTSKRKCPTNGDVLLNTKGYDCGQKRICKRKVIQIPSISEESKNRIGGNQRLNGDDILFFGKLLSGCSDYVPQDTLYIQNLDKIQAIPKTKKHIQILHSRGASGPMTDHWVCSYYDGKNIHIYDSLNIHILHNDYQMYLQRLFPFYSVEQNNVRFPRVHQQQNADDCGVLAIAFGVSLLFRHKPETIEYEYDNLRKHLLNMFETQIITPFPMIKHSDPPLPLPLEEIVKKEHKAYLERTRLDNNAQTATIQSKKKTYRNSLKS
ncbi:uncharacterized protein LOC122849104 isoform X2 [Aphidius gifuensis]|uniref:uncharacterized protein LOC122849104 isoform X1 n=1 Tax=Aphidius gifuensis TaxID=684658 RepID=UPI001CDCC2F4|nr:uncharacterized protein LOC122849104 isoform X1 [Aphidius gifuensis]XP_044003628.1 uncharacterized protein LOC122849104 isoform X2 [Aphidius gifuensis]